MGKRRHARWRPGGWLQIIQRNVSMNHWCFMLGEGCFTSRVAFNGKLERCISLSFAASINFSIFLRSDIFLCLLFILCCFRCLPRSEQDIFNSFRAEGKRWKSKSRSGEWEKCFTNWIENLCYKIYFTISRLKNLASTREILKECLIAYKQREGSTLNYNSTKASNSRKHKFYFKLTSHVNWVGKKATLIWYRRRRREHFPSLANAGFDLWKSILNSNFADFHLLIRFM